MKILVAVDSSEASAIAARAAAGRPWPAGTTAHVIRVEPLFWLERSGSRKGAPGVRRADGSKECRVFQTCRPRNLHRGADGRFKDGRSGRSSGTPRRLCRSRVPHCQRRRAVPVGQRCSEPLRDWQPARWRWCGRTVVPGRSESSWLAMARSARKRRRDLSRSAHGQPEPNFEF
jgi:hypothetical protein